jgi:SusD family./Tetratricopeptide repeat.
MNIKSIKQYIRAGLLCCGTVAVTSSCNDFLDILPMNDVVLENFWTEKADVNSVVNSCYEALQNSDVQTRMGVWGELRSDNMVMGSSVPNEINEILKENLLESNPMCDWSKFYTVINRCNTVCYYAPKVEAIDPNYTPDELRANIAEVSTLRALCYFYLIRTFRDVPYTTMPSIDDSQNYILPATPFDAVLDSLIENLEAVKDDAVRRYYTDDSPSAYQNSSRVTRWFTYTLLADLYLWKGDYDNAIKYCDRVLDFKRQQYKEMLDREGKLDNIELYDGIPLIMERKNGSTNCGNFYNEMFGKGNGFESIFEIYYRANQGAENSWVNSYYGNRNNVLGRLAAPAFLFENVAEGKNQLFKNKDCRAYEAMQTSNSSNAIVKYTRNGDLSFTTQNVRNMASLNLQAQRRSESDANWIIYRLSDVILIKAEAEIARGGEDFTDAFLLINRLNKRALGITQAAQSADTLKLDDYAYSLNKMEDLLIEERQREFLFEGKRWYDLVRIARRDGSTRRLTGYASMKYQEGVNVIKIKLSDPNYIYFPYAKKELKVNPLLKQNPAFNKGEDNELTK